jgi:hypothetical protein
MSSDFPPRFRKTGPHWGWFVALCVLAAGVAVGATALVVICVKMFNDGRQDAQAKAAGKANKPGQLDQQDLDNAAKDLQGLMAQQMAAVEDMMKNMQAKQPQGAGNPLNPGQFPFKQLPQQGAQRGFGPRAGRLGQVDAGRIGPPQGANVHKEGEFTLTNQDNGVTLIVEGVAVNQNIAIHRVTVDDGFNPPAVYDNLEQVPEPHRTRARALAEEKVRKKLGQG